MVQQDPGLLAQLERDVLDRNVPLADLLRTCLTMGGLTRSSRLHDWATAELEGYPRRDSVPTYRVVVAPIWWDVAVPYHGVSTQMVNVQELPDFVREYINETVHLNQPIDELEALVTGCEARGEPIRLAVIGGDLYLDLWNRNNRSGQQGLRMYYVIDPAVVRGVLGKVRTTLIQFVAELRSEVGDTEELPSAAQTDEALQAVVPWAIIRDSAVTIVQSMNQTGDIMTDSLRTTIKGNKTTIKDSSGNFASASEHVTQVNADGLDLEKLRQFAELVAQITPTLGLEPEQQAKLQSGAEELQAAIASSGSDKGRFRRVIDGMLRILRTAGPTAVRAVAIGMGDELMRELGGDVLHQLGH